MRYKPFSILLFLLCLPISGQGKSPQTLSLYIQTALSNSPFIRDFHNQSKIQLAELQRLKSLYTHSKMEINGDYLFVPVIYLENGKSSFKWNARTGTNYYGYDLGESSGHLHLGATWTQPLSGNRFYKQAQKQTKLDNEILQHNIQMEQIQLERAVTEAYLLCLLDKAQIQFADTTLILLKKQSDIITRLVGNALLKQSDTHLISIERERTYDILSSARQSYHNHLMDLNLLCGINDTTDIELSEIHTTASPFQNTNSSIFIEKYALDSLNTAFSLRSFNLQYKPQLNLYINGGLQTGDFSRFYNHFGWSMGISFSWTIFDGKQKKSKEQQARYQWNSILTYKKNAEYQRQLRIRQCLSEIGNYEKREPFLKKQLAEYEKILHGYNKEIEYGQLSVLDYLTVLRNKIQTEKDLLLLQTNKKLAIVAYNYWNH